MKIKFNLILQSKFLRTNQTPWEAKLWYHLRANRFFGLKFKRQVPIDRFIVDFCCQERRLVIELDGGQHSKVKNAILDRQKQNYLEKKGYKILRFWNNQLEDNLQGVLEIIRKSILD